jgi:hypothetical protein
MPDVDWGPGPGRGNEYLGFHMAPPRSLLRLGPAALNAMVNNYTIQPRSKPDRERKPFFPIWHQTTHSRFGREEITHAKQPTSSSYIE